MVQDKGEHPANGVSSGVRAFAGLLRLVLNQELCLISSLSFVAKLQNTLWMSSWRLEQLGVGPIGFRTGTEYFHESA